jgi:hypothetical protein
MSGKNIILLMAVVSAMSGYGMWVFLKDADSTKMMVTAGMEHEFLEYQQVKKQVSDLEIAEQNDVLYTVSYRDPWKFEIHDKTVVVIAPPIRPQPLPELIEPAKAKIKEAVFVWFEDKYGTREKIAIEVSM